MADKLVPIALSSEIDSTGTERVHAAPYTPAARTVWTPPPWEYFISQAGPFGLGTAVSTYGRLNTDTFVVEPLATLTLTGVYPPKSHAGMNMGGDLILLHCQTQVAVTQGIYAYRYNGTSLVQHAYWAINPTLQYDEYHSMIQWDATTLLVTIREYLAGSVLKALTYNGTTFTEVASLSLGDTNYHQVVKHKSHAIVLRYALGASTDGLKAYSFNGSAFALVATYAGTVGAGGTATDRLEADASYIYPGDRRIFNFNGTNAITLAGTVGTAVSSGVKFAAFPGVYVDGISVASAAFNVYTFDGATATLASTFTHAGTSNGYGWMTTKDNLMVAPNNTSYAYDSAIYTLSGTTLTRQAAFSLPSEGTRERYSMTFIDPLTDY